MQQVLFAARLSTEERLPDEVYIFEVSLVHRARVCSLLRILELGACFFLCIFAFSHDCHGACFFRGIARGAVAGSLPLDEPGTKPKWSSARSSYVPKDRPLDLGIVTVLNTFGRFEECVRHAWALGWCLLHTRGKTSTFSTLFSKTLKSRKT